MCNLLSTYLRCLLLVMFFVSCSVNAAEWAIESDVSAKAVYNDNIFMTTLDHDSVSGLIITPSAKMRVRENNWEAFLDTRLRSNNYSDSDIDSNDIYFDLTGSYKTERNTYSLNGSLDFDSNLNSESTDFGIVALRVKKEVKSITPKFSRMITERLMFATNYSHYDVDYVDAGNTGFVPYTTDAVSGSLIYNFSERDQVNSVLQASSYESKDESFAYDLLVARIGMNHKLSESLSVNYLMGGSNRDSSSRSTTAFFNQLITLPPVDSSSSGFVLDAGFEQAWEASLLSGKISRDNTTDSFGGLNEVDKISLEFKQKITQIWRYSISTRYEDITSIDASDTATNREVVFFEPVVNYSLARDWHVNASYRYVRRKFESQTSDRAPDSNQIYLGISYNLPSVSTF